MVFMPPIPPPAEPPAMAQMAAPPPAIAFVGAGRLAGAVAWAAHRAGYPIAAVWSPSGTSARRLARRVGARAAPSAQEAAAVAPLVLLAVPDGAIASVAAELAAAGAVGPGQVVLHASGALDSGALAPAAAAGAWTGSWHPLQTLTGPPRRAAALLRGARVALEGHPQAVAAGRDLALAVGAVPMDLPPGAKPLYHAAAALAANGLVALAGAAVQAWAAAGLDPAQALPALLPLIRGAVVNLGRLGLPAALTGPVARGDAGTVALHLAALARAAPDLVGLYTELSRAALRLAPSPAVAAVLEGEPGMLPSPRRCAP